jgi:hypothetical protein
MKTTRRSVRMYSLQATISLLEGTTAFSFDKDLPGATPELEVGQAPEAVPQLDRSSSLVPRWLRPIQRQSLLGFHMAIHAKEFLALGRTIARPALLETVDDFSEFARPWAGWIEGEIEAEFDDEVHRSARQHFGERGWLVDTTRAKVGTLELLTDCWSQPN